MGSLAVGRGWGSSNAEESLVDPEEESIEESLDDSSLEDSPGSLYFFWGGGLGALLSSRLGGRWGFGLALGAVWGAGRELGGWGCTGGAHAGGGGGGGGSAATCWQCGGAGDRSPMLPDPSMRVARTLPRAAT